MQNANRSIDAYQNITAPVFIVKNNFVIDANDAAKNLNIQIGMAIHILINSCVEEYMAFHTGKLYLKLDILGVKRNAAVTADGDIRIFVISTINMTPSVNLSLELANSIRNPLYSAAMQIDLMYNNAILTNCQDLSSLLLTRQKIYQMMSSLQNVIDADPRAVRISKKQFEYRDLMSHLNECLSRLKSKPSIAERLNIHTKGSKVLCHFDPESLERAMLNLIANAIKHGDGSKPVSVDLKSHPGKLYITVTNRAKLDMIAAKPDLHATLLAEPFLNPYDAGIGYGIKVVRRIALEHGGTLHMCTRKTRSKSLCDVIFTITVSTKDIPVRKLCSPTSIVIDQSGGYDRILLDMAAFLTPDDYK